MKQYLDLMRHVRENGVYKSDRTGTGAYSVFGHQMRFNLADGFPLVTTKKCHLKSIIHELLWFLQGDTNIRYLKENGVKIWDDWADENGDLGPVYGYQWRSWPDVRESSKGVNLTIAERCAEASRYGDYYQRMGVAYAHPGAEERRKALEALSSELDAMGIPKERRVPSVRAGSIDQIAKVIETLKTNPDSRRIIVSAWNPALVDQMALPPCHALFQFYSAPMTVEERVAEHNRRTEVAEKEYNEKTKDWMVNELRTWDYISVPGLRGWSHAKPGEDGLLSDEDAHEVLNRRGVPSRKLSCQLYQR